MQILIEQPRVSILSSLTLKLLNTFEAGHQLSGQPAGLYLPITDYLRLSLLVACLGAFCPHSG